MSVPAQVLRRSRLPRSRQVSIPAPVGGLNTRDPLGAMSVTDAVVCDNWFPDEGHIRLRKGYSSHATGVGSGSVQTVASLKAGSVSKMIAAGGGAIYDVTSAGAATSLKTGFSGNRWQVAEMNATLGLVNGTDAPQTYDGSTVAAMTVSGTGLTVANLAGINVFKSRSYFWEDGSQDFWYSATNTLGGTLTKFPLSRVSRSGGNLVSMANWTRDGGSGPDDFAVFLMSSGEAIVYQGSDPGTAADWALVGIYHIGEPLDVRATLSVGGDVLVVTHSDIVPLSAALISGDGVIRETKLSGAIHDAASAYASTTGWDAVLFPHASMALFATPESATSVPVYGYNMHTGAAFKFTGINPQSWAVHGQNLYFGASSGGVVYKFWDTFGDAGKNIAGDIQQAWHIIGSQAQKRVAAIRPMMSAPGTLSVSVGVGYDYTPAELSTVVSNPSVATPWGSAWGSAWSAVDRVRSEWRMVSGFGTRVSTRIKISTNVQDVRWFSTDMRYELGAGL